MYRQQNAALRMPVAVRDFWAHTTVYHQTQLRDTVRSLAPREARRLLDDIAHLPPQPFEDALDLTRLSLLINHIFTKAYGDADYIRVLYMLQNILHTRMPLTGAFRFEGLIYLFNCIAEMNSPNDTGFLLHIFRQLKENGILDRPSNPFVYNALKSTRSRAALQFFNLLNLPKDPSNQIDYVRNLLYLVDHGVLAGVDLSLVEGMRIRLRELQQHNTPLMPTKRQRIEDATSQPSYSITSATSEPALPESTFVDSLLHVPSSHIISENSDSTDMTAARCEPIRKRRGLTIETSQLSEDAASEAVVVSVIPAINPAIARRSVRIENMRRITQALEAQDIAQLTQVLQNITGHVISPLQTSTPARHSCSSTSSRSVGAAATFFSPSPTATNASVKAPSLVAELIIDYIKQNFDYVQTRDTRRSVINFIKSSSSAIFKVLLSPLHRSRHACYNLAKNGYFNLVIEYIPTPELQSLLDCLFAQGGLRLKECADSFVSILDALNQRMKNSEADRHEISQLYVSLYDQGIEYRRQRGAFYATAHHQVIEQLKQIAPGQRGILATREEPQESLFSSQSLTRG